MVRRWRTFGVVLVLCGAAGFLQPHLAGAAPPGGAGVLTLPLAGPAVVLVPFEAPPHRFGAGHRGVDLAATADSPVHAAASGVVVFGGPLAGRGVVSIQHAGELRTTYEPVVTELRRGERVEAGDVVGTLATGHPRCAPRTCLHWGARIGDAYLNPMLLLRPLRVRLLPWDP